MSEKTLDQLAVEFGNIMSDPHPGLFTWCEYRNRIGIALYQALAAVVPESAVPATPTTPRLAEIEARLKAATVECYNCENPATKILRGITEDWPACDECAKQHPIIEPSPTVAADIAYLLAEVGRLRAGDGAKEN